MSTSEEYLASLGFDTSDVDKAVDRTVTILGHLGATFEDIEKKTSKAERALLGTSRTTQASGSAAKKTSDDFLKLKQSIYDQAGAYRDLQAAQKAASGNQRTMTANESAFARYIAEGEANEKASQSIRSKATALAQEREATVKVTQARTDAVAAQRAEEQARKSELATLRAAITGRNDAARAADRDAVATAKAAIAAEKAAASEQKRNRGLLDQQEILPRLRYALYDVGQVALTTSAGIAGIGVAAATASASYESAFTNVERTLEPGSIAVGELRDQLLGLSREIPLSFQELSGIATLGNQLGIEARNLEGFTGTVARFSAVAGVSYEETAKSFGSMSEILGIAEQDYERLGSAIALVGRRSVATEPEILSLTREIGQQAHQAGFAAEDVIGLAGALGELRVPPERARGSLTTYFQTLTKAVAEGGDKLNDFASVVGMSSEELSQAVRDGRGLEVFQRFLTALSETDTVTATAALDRLGLSQLRVSDVFQRLGSNVDVFNQSIANGRQGWTEGSELARQYALVLDDLATRWQLFLNALMTFGAAVGDQVAPAFLMLLDAGTGVLTMLTTFANSPAGEMAIRLAAVLLTLIGVYAALRGGIALATGAMLALRTAAGALGGAGLIANIRVLAASLGLIKLNADGARVSTIGLAGALKLLLRATVVLGVVQLIASALFDLKSAGDLAIDTLFTLTNAGLQAAQAVSVFLATITGNGQAVDKIGAAYGLVNQNVAGLKKSIKGEWGNFARDMGWMSDETQNFADAAMPAAVAAGDFASGIEDVGNAAGDDGAAAKVRTLVDYASDLSSVMQRAFDIRYGSTKAFDEITGSWNSIRQAIADTNIEIQKYQADMAKLSSDRSIREYWLRVAENYGDALRAGELRAEIADIDADLAKNSQQLSKAQEKNSKTLDGNSDAAIANRSELFGLIQGYQGYIEKLAAAGMPQEQLQAEAARLRQEFINQATQLGYNGAEVQRLAQSFDDMTLAIQRVPRNITVSADTNPAKQALNEFLAQASQATANVNIGGTGGGYGLGQNFAADMKRGVEDYLGRTPIAIDGYLIQGQQVYRVPGTGLKMYRSGTDWTGSGNPNGVAGIVHNRERVLNERGSRMVSGQFVNAANQGRNPWAYAPKMKMPTSSGVSAGGTSIVELSPIDREILASGQKVTVVVASSDIARSVGASNEEDNRRGGA